MVCVLTGHQLKDPTATVAYHSADQDLFDQVLGSRGVRRAGFANREEPLTAPFAPVEEREAESVPQRRDRPDQV